MNSSSDLYGELNIDELLVLLKSKLKELPDAFSESDLAADFKEFAYTIIVKLCDLCLLDVTPDDLVKLSQANLLEVFAFLLEHLSMYDEALNKEKGRKTSQEENIEAQSLGQKEEPSPSETKEWEHRYKTLRDQVEQIKILLKQVMADEDMDLSDISELFSSSYALFEEDGNESILFLLIQFVGQMMQILYDKAKVVETLEARIRYLQRELYAPKSERRPIEEDGDTNEDPEDINEEDTDPKNNEEEVVDDVHETESETEDKWIKSKKEKRKKKKGGIKGHKGYGRKIPEGLSKKEVYIHIPKDSLLCPKCGTSYRVINNCEQSHEIEQLFTIVHNVILREKAVKQCTCDDVPTFITAPLAPKIIPESKYSTETWIQYLVEKYFLQVPLNRQMRRAIMYGHKPCRGTITGGLKKFIPILDPLYQLMIEEVRKAKHWHVDETSWRMFIYVNDKENYRWWLWVFIAPKEKITIYVLDPYRSSKVPLEFFKAAMGIINVDRYCAYSPLEKIGFLRAFCWFHLRRDFDRCGKDYSKLREWAEDWILMIGEMHRINDLRMKAFESEDMELFTKYHYELIEIARAFEAKRDEQLTLEDLHTQQSKILKSMLDNRDSYFLFIDNPIVPMDNNLAERKLRMPVVGRKNYYGNHSFWGGELLTICMSIFETANDHGIDPVTFLRIYFDACAKAEGSVPDNIKDYLPWNIPSELVKEYQCKEKEKDP